MKRSLIAMGLLICLLLTGCGNADTGAKAEPQKPEKIRLAYSTSLTSALIIVAKQMGWFEEEFQKDGIPIEYNKFMNGPPIIEAFGGGRLDVGQVGDQPAIQAKANHIDIKVIGIFCKGIFTPEGKYTAVVVPTGSAIKTIPDLKGKKVGVPVGTNYHKAFLYFLKYHGLTVDRKSVV
jgi:sulfonate transport system substrate-binding protein